MARVLVLFASSDEQESKTLSDLLQAKLGTSYNLSTIKGILAEDITLHDELTTCSCTVLVASKQSCELINSKKQENDCGGIVIFDGAVIHQHVEENSNKTVVVKLGSSEHAINGYDMEKAIPVEGELNAGNPALDQVADSIKGTVSSKANDKPARKVKSKKNCTQM